VTKGKKRKLLFLQKPGTYKTGGNAAKTGNWKRKDRTNEKKGRPRKKGKRIWARKEGCLHAEKQTRTSRGNGPVTKKENIWGKGFGGGKGDQGFHATKEVGEI